MSHIKAIVLLVVLLVPRIASGEEKAETATDIEAVQVEQSRPQTEIPPTEDVETDETPEKPVNEQEGQDSTVTLKQQSALPAEEARADDSLVQPADEEQTDEEEKKADLVSALKQEPGFKLNTQIGALFKVRDEYLKPENEFRVSRARLKLSWRQGKLIRAVLKIEARQLFKSGRVSSLLRDLYIRVKPFPWLGLRVGQFKKPFSRVELSSWNKFKLIDRGIANDYLAEELLYGDRDIGAMLEGRLWQDAKLDYAVGVFNGMGRNASEIGLGGTKDVVARLEAEPLKWLDVGANGSFKFIEKTDLPGFVNQNNFSKVIEDEYPLGYSATDFIEEYSWMSGMSWMTGVDTAFKLDKLRVIGEVMFGQNWWFEKFPYTWSADLIVSYKYKLIKGVPLWIEPAVRGGVLTFLCDGNNNWRVRLWQVTPGINLHIGRHVRLMVNGEFDFSEGTEADIDGSRREGLWPNEFPGTWSNSKKFLVQITYSI